MANWDVTTAGASLEFDTVGYGTHSSCYQIDSNHFINFWGGEGTDGYVQVFTVNTSTWAVTTANASLEFDTSMGYHNSCYQIDSNHFINFWAGSGDDGYVQVFTVNTSTWAVTTAGASIEFDGTNGEWNSCYQIDSNHFINFWAGSGDDGYVQVFTVNTSTWAVTEATRLEFDTVSGYYNSCYQIDSNHFINFWAGTDNDGFVQAFEVNTSTWAVTTAGARLEFDTDNGSYNSCYQIDSNRFINFWGGAGGDGFTQVFTVNTSTWAVTTAGASLEFDTVSGYYNSCYQIDSNHFINFWGRYNAAGYTQAFEVNTSTWAVTTAGASIIFDSTYGLTKSCCQIDSSHFINFWQGAGLNGFVQVFAVEVPASTPAFSTLSDNFNDNSFNASLWTRDSATYVVETNNQLELSTGTTAAYYGCYSATTYDLDSVSVELVSAGNQSLESFEAYPLEITKDASNWYKIFVIGGTIYFRKRVGGSNSTQTEDYSSTNHRWLRIRISGDDVLFEKSADGMSWSSAYTTTKGFTATGVELSFSVGTWQNEASTTKMIIDNFNVYPKGNSERDFEITGTAGGASERDIEIHGIASETSERDFEIIGDLTIPYSDDFDDNTLDTNKWTESTNAGSLVEESDGRIKMISNSSISAYVRSSSAFSPQNTILKAKVLNHSTDGGFKLCPTDPSGHQWDVYSENNWYNFQLVSGPKLSVVRKAAGSVSTRATMASNLSGPPYWMRIRIDETTVYFDYADQSAEPAEGEWTTLHSETWGIGTGITQENYTYFTSYNTPTTGAAHFDDFSWSINTPSTTSERDFEAHGIASNNSARDFEIHGAVSDNSERDFEVHGIASDNSERDFEITGNISDNSERGFEIYGNIGDSLERIFEVHGVDSDNSERSFELHGIANNTSERDFEVTGNVLVDSEREFEVDGVDNTATERSIEIHGESNETSEKDFEVYGVTGDNSERSFEIGGISSTTSERGFEVHGIDSEDNNSERDFEVHGIDSDNAERAFEIDANIGDNSERDIEIHGIDNETSERSFEAQGVASTNSERGFEIHGIVSETLERVFEVHGVVSTTSERDFEIEGISSSLTGVKTINETVVSSVKTINGTTIANIKEING